MTTLVAPPARRRVESAGKEKATRSCLYVGYVRHRRRQPKRHDFKNRLFMVFLDLDEIDELFVGRWFWSTKRPALARFKRKHYLGPAGRPLKEAVWDVVESKIGRRPAGPVRMLTHLRYYGYCFNPVTFYYCMDERDEFVDAVCAEITNTPWGERHCYVLDGRDPSTGEPRPSSHRFRFEKEFHVSPFMDMEQDYQWLFTSPGEQLAVHMENRRDDELLFDVTLHMKRREMTGWNLARTLLTYPFVTAKVIAAIYFQALRLRLKRVPFHAHPDKAPKS